MRNRHYNDRKIDRLVAKLEKTQQRMEITLVALLVACFGMAWFIAAVMWGWFNG
jgi:hypothetical protein